MLWFRWFLRSRVHSDEQNLLVLFVLHLLTVCVLFLFIASITYSSHRCLDVSLFEKIQDYKIQDFTQ
jgi:hypothetical protein